MVSKCRICDRLLTSKWAEVGIGPVCASKTGITFGDKKPNQQKGDDDDLVGYDGGDLFIERLEAMTETFVEGFGTVVECKKHTASGCRSNVPRQIYRHSPTGYNFGYGGSGPSDFALNCCLLIAKHADDAYGVYQDFKRKFVEGAQGDRLSIPRVDAEKFFTDMGIQVKTR